MADEIDRQTDKRDQELYSKLKEQKEKRKRERKEVARLARELDDPDYSENVDDGQKEDVTHRSIEEYVPHRCIEDIFWYEMRKVRANKERDAKKENKPLSPSFIFKGLNRDEFGRFEPKHPLAQYLFHCARLFEYLATFQDFQLLEKYLFEKPPLHPRRTLDQAYLWKLKSTRRRDRDQVVYRYTHEKFLHKFQPQFKPDPCAKERRMESWEWSGHEKDEDKHGCRQCEAESKKLSRVIMVDQLWMWILDGNTIITFFPQRYGVGKNDPSGVHQSIRERLADQNCRDNHVRSVFDLGLIILDECFDTFFDRTITLDKRPQIMDIFGESIGSVVGYTPRFCRL
jgi:hypothetical protein